MITKTVSFFSRYNREYYGGGLMFLLGVGAVWRGYDYQIGTLTEMGAGFFPAAVGAILAAMGVLIALGAKRDAANQDVTKEEKHPPEWRGWICIALANAAFVVLGHHGGLIPATFAVVFIAALGDRQNTLMSAFLLALTMVAVSVVVFWWALKLQLPLFMWS